MNVLDNLWMSRVTSHVSLRTALDQITPERIDAGASRSPTRTMRGAGFAAPRIAVAALNPHGGENGLFGREEIEIIAPAVARAAARGIRCRGPFPADTVFLKAFAGDYDGVLTMYHDQGQIATKLKGFNRGVTVTGGLRTVFTTPAHGTAFDIVGKGIATTGALEQAVRLVRAPCRRRASDNAAPPHSGRCRITLLSEATTHHARFTRRSRASVDASLTDYVAGFVVATRAEDIPADVAHLGKRSVLDGIGLALAGAASQTGRHRAALPRRARHRDRGRQHRDRQRPAPARALRGVRQRHLDPRRRLRRHAARGRQGSRLRPAHASDRAGAAAGAGARRARRSAAAAT